MLQCNYNKLASKLAQSANVQNRSLYIIVAPARVMWYKTTNQQQPSPVELTLWPDDLYISSM